MFHCITTDVVLRNGFVYPFLHQMEFFPRFCHLLNCLGTLIKYRLNVSFHRYFTFSAEMPSGKFRYKSGKNAKYAETLSEDEDKNGGLSVEEGISISATTFIAGGRQTAFPGGPFSALCPSMVPQDILVKLQHLENSRDQPEYRFDEFGFKVEIEDGPEENSSKILSIPLVEDPQHRLRWIAHLEFTHNQVVEDLTWQKVEPLLPKSDKLANMVKSGVPHSLRPYIWPRLCGSILKKRQTNFTYKEIMKESADDRLNTSKQIEKDLLRTLPNNVCFMNLDSTGIPRLRRILRAVAYLYPEIGYCQGTGVIVGSLLLFMEEEDVFWMICTIIEDLLPGSYFSRSLIGLQADQRVLKTLISTFLPDLDGVFTENDIELSLISVQWFLTLFSGSLHVKILLRIWDLFFYEGSTILFKVALGMLRMRESELRRSTNSAQLFNILSDLPAFVEDADFLLDITFKVASSLSDATVAAHRKKNLALLLVEQGVLVNPEASGSGSLPKQHVNRRKLKRSQSFVAHIFGADAATASRGSDLLNPEDVRLKNVRQTELLIDLKDAALKVCKHFQSVEPSLYNKAQLAADYSVESHTRDHENFVAVHKNRQKRARALLDFERHDDDELGFRRNDIISIISQKDEHCWIGELNGLRGWFPAKFVELLDERSKCYSAYGDDAVNAVITDLVRGTLAPAIKAIFEHGIKRSSVLGGPCHPWLFVEEVANREVEKDFDSVYSRLVLCRTYKLDEDGKVLTPEELLYKAVQQVNVTHNASHAQMDVKFRSLICLGLNEQVLHLWFELLCLCQQDIVRRWYQKWSYIRSPGWVQVKCDLRVLSQFSFNLNPDWELDESNREPLARPLKEGVRDMLVKHHLFSWDL